MSCICKDASRNNSCKGLPDCSLRANHPERKNPKAKVMSELKPCPFCGKEELRQSSFIAALDVYYKIRCAWCGGQCEGRTDEEAVSNWNTRAVLAQEAWRREPVATFIRFRDLLTPADIDPDGVGHWNEWSSWRQVTQEVADSTMEKYRNSKDKQFEVGAFYSQPAPLSPDHSDGGAVMVVLPRRHDQADNGVECFYCDEIEEMLEAAGIKFDEYKR